MRLKVVAGGRRTSPIEVKFASRIKFEVDGVEYYLYVDRMAA
jgi:hypothetical protein